MESIVKIVKTPQTAQKTANLPNVCNVFGKELNYFVEDDGKIKISMYNDEIATPQQIRELLNLLFVAFSMDESERTVMLAVVARKKMTVSQLRDSVNNYLDYGIYKPKPAEIVNYNAENTDWETFTPEQVGKIICNVRSFSYDMEKKENIINSTQIFERLKNSYFSRIRKPNGELLRDKNNSVVFILTEHGRKNRQILEQFQNITNHVEFHDSRINLEKNV